MQHLKSSTLLRFIFSLLFFLTLAVYSYAKNTLLYPIKNFRVKDYKASTQNWDILQMKDGTICFANNDGLLIKQGNEWSKYNTANWQIVRRITEYKNKIYSGGGNEVGYFIKEESGRFKYIQLLEFDQLKLGEIWSIKIINEKVYFQGSKMIFCFDTNNDKLLYQKELGYANYFTIYQNRLYFQSVEHGLYSTDLEYNDHRVIIESTLLKDIVITDILNLNGSYYIFSLSNGIFQIERNKLTPLTKNIQDIAIKKQIYTVERVKEGIAIGTIMDGIYLLDFNLNIKKHINITSGLRNNTVLSLLANDVSNLWVGLDNGISFIETNSQYQFYNFDNNIGSGYSSFKYQNYNYWGTNQGLFYTNDSNPKHIELIEGTQGQVWCIEGVGDDVYCGHHKGLFKVNGQKAELIDNKPGYMNIVRLNNHSDYYIATLYYQTILFKYSEGRRYLENLGELDSPFHISRDIKVAKDQWMWITNDEGIVKFKIDTISHSFSDYKVYEREGYKQLFLFNNDIWIWDEKNFYQYVSQKDAFEAKKPVCTFQNKKDLFEMLFHIPAEILCEKIEYCDRYIGDMPNIRNLLKWNVKIHNSYSSHCVLNSNDGFIYFDDSSSKEKGKAPTIVMSEIKVKTKTDLEYYWTESNILDYRFNNIRFKFYSSREDNNIEYQYRLNGYEESFSSFSDKNIKEYTNLPEGCYSFEVRCKDISGSLSLSSKYDFEIKPPFYRSNSAKILYLILLSILMVACVSFVKYLLKEKEKQINKIRQKEIEELEKTHKIENLNKEHMIILMEKTQLEDSISHKQRELANSTHSIVLKNNLLIKIKELLQSIYKEKDCNLRDSKLSKIFVLIKENIDNESDWAVFEGYFSEIHQNFFRNLKKDFPDISTTDLKLCAYIKLNKSTKEIASLMNISIRGVETSRYRLRKKLNLSRDENIIDILSRY